jgi:lysozyme
MRRLASLSLSLSLALAAGCGAPDDLGVLEEANTTQCPKMVVEGVDVYDGNGKIDWAQVQGAGRGFAILKASQGDYNTQATFPANWAGAKAAGVLRSPYHFFDPTIDGVTQANHFLAVLNKAGGLQPGDLPPMLDLECPTSSVQGSASPNCEYKGNSGWVPSATLAQRVFAWLDTVEKATGRKALIYSYPSWFAGVGFTDPKLAQYPLYIATLSNCASVPPPWTSAVFWQYSWTGNVAGIPTQVDLDRFFGDGNQLMTFASPPPPPDAAMPPDGGTGDAARPPDAAPRTDLAPPADATPAPDLGAAPAPHGCGCRLGGARPSPLLLIGLLGLLAARLRSGRQPRKTPVP